MTEHETGFLGRHGRSVWGGVAALLLLVLLASFVLVRREEVAIGVICTPAGAAQEVADKLVAAFPAE